MNLYSRIERSKKEANEADCYSGSNERRNKPDNKFESKSDDGVEVDRASLAKPSIEVDEDESAKRETSEESSRYVSRVGGS